MNSMIKKLRDINNRAQESLFLTGTYNNELNELKQSDIPASVIKKYRSTNPELSYIYDNLKENKLLASFGILNLINLKKNSELKSTDSLKQEIDNFLIWKPDYTKYDTSYEEGTISGIIPDFKTNDNIKKLSKLQGARFSQMKCVKKLTKIRRIETSKYYEDYYGDSNFLDNLSDDWPFKRFQKLMTLVENQDLIEDADKYYVPSFKPYSFTRCLSKARINTKIWTKIVNGSRPLSNYKYLALVLAFYLGLDTLADIELFLNCFSISLNSPTEMINNVPITDIKDAILYGIHFDNIIYYLRPKLNDEL